MPPQTKLTNRRRVGQWSAHQTRTVTASKGNPTGGRSVTTECFWQTHLGQEVSTQGAVPKVPHFAHRGIRPGLWRPVDEPEADEVMIPPQGLVLHQSSTPVVGVSAQNIQTPSTRRQAAASAQLCSKKEEVSDQCRRQKKQD